MLGRLSGRSHRVVTGVCLTLGRNGGGAPRVVSFATSTAVNFATLDAGTIEAYVATGEPMDKAGSYGIQGVGGSLVTSIEGCFYNVMVPM